MMLHSLLTPRRPRKDRRPTVPYLEHLEDRNLMSADPVMEWNSEALQAAVIDHGIGAPGIQFGPTRASRAFAIVQIAIFDAVNSIKPEYDPYLIQIDAPKDASITAAVAQAGHDTLSALYPYLKSMFDAQLAADLKGISNTTEAAEGVAVGQMTAAAILAARANDGSQVDAAGQPVNYTYGQQPGQWRPDPLHPNATPLTPDWGGVTPFAVPTAETFKAPPPPSITSKEYADAYEEVKALGGDGVTTPTIRTEDQTNIGFFWGYDVSPGLCAPVRFYNQIAQTIANQQGNTVTENARFFALINIAMADAAITCWDTKYDFNYWRPVTGIEENDPGTGPTGLGSGNPFLVGQGDKTWHPLGAPADNGSGTNFTPPFPSYTSGHAAIGGALFETMIRFYGRDDIHFTIVSDEFNSITKDQFGNVRPLLPRSYTSFSQAREENGMSRIYLGIHWNFDKVQGIDEGNDVADYTFSHFLRKSGQSGQEAADKDSFLVSGVLSLLGNEKGLDIKLVVPPGITLQAITAQKSDAVKTFVTEVKQGLVNLFKANPTKSYFGANVNGVAKMDIDMVFAALDTFEKKDD
jgi:hypothetical protein